MMRLLPGVALILFAAANGGAQPGDDLARLNDLGATAWNSSDFSAAAAWYERAMSLAPDAPEPLYDLALSYYRLKSYDLSLRYLDRAQAKALDPLRGKCLLLRADIEYRNALTQNATGQVEGLERALGLYRLALSAGADPKITKYDIEVVKLRLPPARAQAPRVGADSQQDVSADETAAGSAGSSAKGQGRANQQEDRDW